MRLSQKLDKRLTRGIPGHQRDADPFTMCGVLELSFWRVGPTADRPATPLLEQSANTISWWALVLSAADTSSLLPRPLDGTCCFRQGVAEQQETLPATKSGCLQAKQVGSWAAESSVGTSWAQFFSLKTSPGFCRPAVLLCGCPPFPRSPHPHSLLPPDTLQQHTVLSPHTQTAWY